MMEKRYPGVLIKKNIYMYVERGQYGKRIIGQIIDNMGYPYYRKSNEREQNWS